MRARPTLKSPCVADTHHGPNERIAEFSFPNGKGGLIALRQHPELCIVEIYRCDEGIEVRAGNAKDWVDPTRTPVAAPPSRWAAYAGSAGGSDISLHADRLSALQHVYLLLDVSDGNDDPDEPMDAERLEELIEDHCNAGADDWHVQEIA